MHPILVDDHAFYHHNFDEFEPVQTADTMIMITIITNLIIIDPDQNQFPGVWHSVHPILVEPVERREKHL